MKNTITFGLSLIALMVSGQAALANSSQSYGVNSRDTGTLADEKALEAKNYKPFDASNQQLLYEMSKTDGAADAQIASGPSLERRSERVASNAPVGSNMPNQLAGQMSNSDGSSCR